MQVTNLQLYRGLEFSDYQALQGWSYSAIKNEGQPPIVPTEKMKLGTAVHNYLLEPKNYAHQQRSVVAPIAARVREIVGPGLLAKMETELSVTASFTNDGLWLPYRGRLDMVRVGRLVIDLKVSAVPIATGCERFGYDKQVSGYCIATGCKTGIIVRVCPTKPHDVEVKVIPVSADWWEFQVSRLGARI